MGVPRGAEAVEALRSAAAAVGLVPELAPSDSGADLVLINPAGGRVLVQVKHASLVSADSLGRQLGGQSDHAQDAFLVVLVGDRVTEQARQMLRDLGGSWLDLRGHLHLAGRQLFVDAEVPRLKDAPRQPTPLAGNVGQEVAAVLLLDPTRAASVREIARRLDRSPSSVSQALASMRKAELIDNDGKPTLPDLFWELAGRWHPESKDVQRYPSAITGATGSIDHALRLGLDDIETTTGWALSDTMAAAAYGAAIVTRSDHPPDFYVPDRAIMRRAIQLLGPALSHDARAATIRVAPFPLVCAHRIDLEQEIWPLARPLFVALDLAQDPDRGRSILEGWTPPQGAGQRVW